MQYFHYKQPFRLENGEILPELTVAYHCFGTLNADKSNVVWVCHHLTASSNAVEWWPGMVGENYTITPERYFIVCANIIGSCYGTTGPLSNNPQNGEPYYSSFPFITIRDMVNAHILLRKHLEIDNIHLVVGGSMGGYQALEWAVMEKEIIGNLFLLATSPAESAWGIAIHTAQRLSIEADGTWQQASAAAGSKGLKAARAIGMLTYRNYSIMVKNQTDEDPEKLDHFKASSYMNYQGDKLVKRFNAYSYWLLTKAMDSHNISRGRGGNKAGILQSIKQKTLLLSITNDILCPLQEQEFMAANLPNATLVQIDSVYGHDGFMVETEKISAYLRDWLDTLTN